jgi:protein-S-isoprenylcysteine O-methyltransferase Ste14
MRAKAHVILGVILAIAAIGQVILSFVLYDQSGVAWVRNLGWILLAISAVFGWLPILTFRRQGGVAKGQSYTQTTKLVDSGLYSIVRHPQYFAGVLVALALPLIAQHWLVAALGAVTAATSYAGTFYEEQSCISQFGDAYRNYAAKVPRMNAVLGIIRWLTQRRSRG